MAQFETLSPFKVGLLNDATKDVLTILRDKLAGAHDAITVLCWALVALHDAGAIPGKTRDEFAKVVQEFIEKSHQTIRTTF